MISTHFWDAKNQKIFGNLKSYERQNNLIPWIGSQGQLKKLFKLLVKPKKKGLIEWHQMSYTEICKHFTNQKKQQPFKPLNLSKQNKPVSIDELQEKVWSYQSDIETHTVETHIYRLRKKILSTFSNNEFIISKKDGYQIK